MSANSDRSGVVDSLRVPAPRSKWLRWLMPAGLLAAGFTLQALATRYPDFVERHYSRRLFPPISRALSFLNGLVSFSIAELMLYVSVAFMVGVLLYQTREIISRRRRIIRVLRSDLLAMLWLSGAGLMLFLLFWGLNYQRESLGTRLGLDGRSATDDQLKMISETIVSGVNANYGASHPNRAGDPTGPAPHDRAQIYELIEFGYEQEPLLSDVRARRAPPKPIYFSGIMSRLGLSGFYMPFTGEANFNAAQPDFDLPYVMAHEKAHQRGFAREDEANFLAFLVCVNSSDPYVRYSGYLNALKVISASATTDPEYYRTLIGQIGEGPRSDLRTRNAFWARYQGRTSALASRVNNSYLKANRVESGVRNYSEDISLIVGYYLKQGKAAQN